MCTPGLCTLWLQLCLPTHSCPAPGLPLLALPLCHHTRGEQERGPGLRCLGTPAGWHLQYPAHFPCAFIWHQWADGYAGQSCQSANWPRAPSGWCLDHSMGCPPASHRHAAGSEEQMGRSLDKASWVPDLAIPRTFSCVLNVVLVGIVTYQPPGPGNGPYLETGDSADERGKVRS